MDFTKEKKQLMSAGRWNQSALKPHLVSNGKNIKDYYPRRQKGHEHLPQWVHAKFRRTISQGNTVTAEHQCQHGDLSGAISILCAIKNAHVNPWPRTHRHFTRGPLVNIQSAEELIHPTATQQLK